jgi:hypothetical protein
MIQVYRVTCTLHVRIAGTCEPMQITRDIVAKDSWQAAAKLERAIRESISGVEGPLYTSLVLK